MIYAVVSNYKSFMPHIIIYTLLLDFKGIYTRQYATKYLSGLNKLHMYCSSCTLYILEQLQS